MSGYFEFTPDGEYHAEFFENELPEGYPAVAAQDLASEFEVFPRADTAIPQWMRDSARPR